MAKSILGGKGNDERGNVVENEARARGGSKESHGTEEAFKDHRERVDHFQNVYDLLQWMLEQEALEVVKNFDLVVDTEEALRFVMDYVDNNRHIINSAFDSTGHEGIKRFFYNDLFSVFYGVIEQGEDLLGGKLEPQFKKFLAAFYTEASAGLLIEWVKNRTSEDREVFLQNLLSIYKISIPAVLGEMKTK